MSDAPTNDTRRPDSTPRYFAKNEAHNALMRAAADLSLAADNLNEVEGGERLMGEMSYLVGGLSQAVESLAELLTKPTTNGRSSGT